MDIRNPIGLLFTILGLILIGLGTFGDAAAKTAKSLPEHANVNINLWWGCVILVFGLAMLIPALLAKKGKCKDGESCCCKK